MHIIAHLDMDAFFAAVEERNNPQFAGLPIAVGSDPQFGSGRGVVSTANYAARAYGIYSATPIQKAWQMSQAARQQGNPEVIFLPGSWSAYRRSSKNIMNIIRRHAEHVHQRGVDEAYIDLSHTKSFTKAEQLAQQIKDEIKEKERLTASIGIGPNKLVAKIASDLQKPDGLVVVPPDKVIDTLAPLPVRAIPGIGPKTEMQLRNMGVKTVADLQQCSQDTLTQHFKSYGLALYQKAHGQGSVSFTDSGPAKSISEQRTFPHDTTDSIAIINKVMNIAEHLIDRLSEEDLSTYQNVTVIVRFADFQTTSTSHTLKQPAHTVKQLKEEALRLLLPYFDHRKNPRHKSFRLVGLRLEKLT